jgi:AcrR family transcriptional regulator
MARPKADQIAVQRTRPGGRSARVVEGILLATANEISEHGYSGMSIERVAERAGVNKTTVYRRWPARLDLVSAMLHEYSRAFEAPPATGDFEHDLRALGKLVRSRWSTPYSRCVLRLMSDLDSEELQPLIARLHRQFAVPWHTLFDDMKARGVVRGDVNTLVVIKAMVSTIAHHMIRDEKLVDAKFMNQVIDLILFGVLARPPKRASARPNKRV